MKRTLMMVLACLLGSLPVFAQRAVQLGRYTFVPEQNIASTPQGSRGGGLLRIGNLQRSYSSQYNALIQFREQPKPREIAQLARQGIILGDYVGGHAYYALIAEAAAKGMPTRSSQITSVMALKPEWKMAGELADNQIPDYARAGAGLAKVQLGYAENATPAQLKADLSELGATDIAVLKDFHLVLATLPVAASRQVAELPYILTVGLANPPEELHNYSGSVMSRARTLNRSTELGGRALRGEGMKIGIWDANVVQHVDFTGRVHTEEYSIPEEHGTHVAGTVLGAGLIDPKGQGMAPKAQAWAYNIGKGSNGKIEQVEMIEARRAFGIVLTQNSYGLSAKYFCNAREKLVYRTTDWASDYLTNAFPTLTHVYSCGNDGGECQQASIEHYGAAGYGTITKRAKNVILVGAATHRGDIVYFSSRGPSDDGRLVPTVVAKGSEVWSTKPGGQYQKMSGTSMACPTTSGTLALIAQRYGQLNQGREIRTDLLKALVANTADDRGVAGPDFVYGYGILNAEVAVEALEHGYYHLDSVEVGGTYTQQIPIPAGTQGLRVMIGWVDPAVQKTYTFGMKAMVNDLDLSVKAGTTNYLPWVCDPTKGHVEDPAQRKVDNLNNLEQVTLNAEELAGQTSITVTVKGTEVDRGHQHFALTWWIEDGVPQVESPAYGQQFAPGEDIYTVLRNVKAPYTIELSYDNGKTYKRMGRMVQERYYVFFPAPADAPLTDQALIRVSDATGRIAVSPKPFTIAPRMADLSLQTPECGYDGWKLSWRKDEKATAGVEVLVADARTAQFEKVGETVDAQTTEFTLPAEKLRGIFNPVVTVAAKIPSSKSLGMRAVGVEAKLSQPLKLTAIQLPFEETFRKTPSLYFSPVNVGSRVRHGYLDQELGDVPVGSAPFYFEGSNKDKTFDPNDYFGDGKNTSNRATFSMCELDLTDIPASEQVILDIEYTALTQDESDLSTNHMRVRSGDKVLTTLDGRSDLTGNGRMQHAYYPLATGQKHQVNIDFSFMGSKDKVHTDVTAIVAIRVTKAPKDPGIALSIAKSPKNGPGLGTETFTLELTNRGVIPHTGILIKAYRNGQWVADSQVEELKPLETKSIELPVDLSTEKKLGQLYDIRFEAFLSPSAPKANATASHTVNSMGAVFPMPGMVLGENSYGVPTLLDPKMTVTVDKPIVFTDEGGYLQNYTEGRQVTLKFLPAQPGLKIRLRMVKFEGAEDNGALNIITVQTPPTLDLRNARARDVLTGICLEPRTYVSEAEDGGITLRFQALYGNTGPGWLAEVDQVPAQNPLAITHVEARQTGNADSALVPVKVTLLNRWVTPQKKVLLTVFGESAVYGVDTLTVEPGEKEYTLRVPVWLKAQKPEKLLVTVEGDDTEQADNEMNTYGVYDRYCIPHNLPLPESKLYARSLRVYKKYYSLLPSVTGAMRYSTKDSIPLYTDEGQVEVLLSTNGTAPEGCSAAIYVDWNDDGVFAETERVLGSLPKGKNKQVIMQLDPGSATPGAKRMRIVIGKTDELTSACNDTPLTLGDIQDLMVNLKAGKYPGSGDFALLAIDAGQLVGKNLSASQPLKVTVGNNSNTDYSGSLQIEIQIDGGEKVKETVDCSAKAIPAFGGKQTFTLTSTANLSAAGKHTIIASVLETPVVDASNNADTVEVWNIVPQAGALYNLHTLSRTNKKDMVDAHFLAAPLKAIPENGGWTMEFLINPDYAEYSGIAWNKSLQIFTTNDLVNYPDNGILLQLGSKMRAYTKKPGLLKPRTWNHVVVVVDEISQGFLGFGGSCKPKIYINGENCEVGIEGEDFPTFQDGKLSLFYRFDGRVKYFRAWKKALTLSEAQAHPYAYLPRSADGKLPEGCLTELTFDEGPTYPYTLCDENYAQVVADTITRLNATDNSGIWEKVDRLIGDFDFAKEVEDREVTPAKEYVVVFEKGTDLANVTGEVIAAWPNVAITYKGNPVSASTVYDFTTDVVLTAKGTLFGQYTVEQTITLKAEFDLSSECELLSLSLKKTNNAGLLEDVAIRPVEQTCRVELTETQGRVDDPAHTKVDFTLSPEAKLYVHGKEVASPAELDLREPTLVLVRAANGNIKRYSIALQAGQSISWTLASNEFTYGDADVMLDAKSSAGLPLWFTSTNGQVATATDGKLKIGVPGTTTITATQPGQGIYAPATPVQKEITVKKPTITVQADVTDATAGHPISWQWAYSALVNPEDARSLPDPFAMEAFTLQDAHGNAVDKASELAKGTYTLKVKGSGAGYSTDYYEVKPVESSITVKQGDLWQVALLVKDAQGPLQGATVQLSETLLTTGNDGVAKFYLPEGALYSFTIRRDGYGKKEETVDLRNGADKQIEVTLEPATIALTYTADAHGKVLGATTQMVVKGGDGEEVLAVPTARGYVFDRWNDNGSEKALRSDTDVQGAVNAEALFKKLTFTATYTCTNGGHIKGSTDTQATQQIDLEGDGQEIEVEPDADHYFARWSDGVTTAKRTDRAVTGNINVTALFVPYAQLPYLQDFESGQLLDGWFSTSTVGDGKVDNPWMVTNKPRKHNNKPTALSGYFALVQSDIKGTDAKTEAFLYSPIFKLDNETADIVVSTNYIFPKRISEYFSIQYSVDGGATWEVIGEFGGATTPSYKERTIRANKLTGKTTLQLCWRYYAPYADFAMVDNISISRKPATGTKYTYTYTAATPASGSFVLIDGTTETPASSQQVDYGKLALDVKAVAASGYKFLKWDDGSTNATLYSPAVATENRDFTATFIPEDQVSVTLLATAPDWGECQLDGTATQGFTMGRNETKTVKAVAKSGYRFARWAEDGDTIAERTIATPTSDVTLTAIFEKRPASLTATIAVMNELNQPLKDALITLPNGQTLTTDAEGKATTTAMPEGSYPYSVQCDHYLPGHDVLWVSEYANEFAHTLIWINRISIKVIGNGKPLADATVTLGDESLKTDADGIAAFAVLNGEYTCTVAHPWYKGVKGSLRFSFTADSELPVELEANLYPVTFTVTDGSTPLPGVKITINNQSPETDANGTVTVQLPSDTFTYTARKNGYTRFAGTVTVAGAQQSVDVVLKKAPEPGPVPVVDLLAEVEIAPNPFVSQLTLRGVANVEVITILQANGAVAFTSKLAGEDRTTLELGHLPAGTYVLVLKGHGQERTLRIVKQ